jgi:hypothetical protein
MKAKANLQIFSMLSSHTGDYEDSYLLRYTSVKSVESNQYLGGPYRLCLQVLRQNKQALLASCCFLPGLTLLPWKWRWHASQNIEFFKLKLLFKFAKSVIKNHVCILQVYTIPFAPVFSRKIYQVCRTSGYTEIIFIAHCSLINAKYLLNRIVVTYEYGWHITWR